VSAPSVPAALRARRWARDLVDQLSALRRWAGDAARGLFRREAWTRERWALVWTEVRRRPRQAAFLLGGLVLAAVLVSALSRRGAGPPGVPTAAVAEGPFSVTIVEGGTLQALRSVTYASTIQSNQAKIVALVPEGKLVKKGDLLILFDSAPFEEEIRRNQALLAQAEADLLKAQQDLKLQTIQNQEDLIAARLKVERSDLELKDMQEGKGKLKEEEAVAAVANAERELQKSKTALDDLRPLLAEGFITRAELERAEQQVARSEEELKLAQRRRDAFLGYGRPLELTQAKAEASQSKESLRQLESAASFRLEQKRAATAAAESRIAEADSKLSLAREQLARTEVKADVDGIVVYRDVFFGSEQRKPQVGDQVWANQPLLILPDITKMVVETKIRETDIHKVEKNQQVDVRVEAYPDLRLTGQVSLVGTLAQEEKERRGAKFFGVSILVTEPEPRLRPGMTARVEIRVQESARATYVPLEAVFEKDGRPVVYLARAGRAVPRDVVLGPSNQDFVVVEKGVAAGDRVCLRDPDAPASDFGSLTSE
jgi:HlyD family secretion protein